MSLLDNDYDTTNSEFSFLDNYKKHYNLVNHFKQPESKVVIILNCCGIKNSIKTLIPAYQRYKGKDFIILNDLIFKENRRVDIYVISAQYGLIPYTEIISDYNVTFNDINEKDIKNMSNELKIREDLEKVLENYDMCFILFGKKYGLALDIEKEFNNKCTFISFGKEMSTILKSNNKIEIDININTLSSILKGYRSANVKTYVIKELLLRYTDEDLINNPSLINKFVEDLYNQKQKKTYLL